MPSNILRNRTAPLTATADDLAATVAGRVVLITTGRAAIRVRLLPTVTAARIFQALPLHATAETWGQTVHFELPVETGREPEATRQGTPGDISFWSEESRVIVAFGPTPISGPGEIRLPSPCNVWAKAIDDVSPWYSVTPGEKVSVTVVPV